MVWLSQAFIVANIEVFPCRSYINSVRFLTIFEIYFSLYRSCFVCWFNSVKVLFDLAFQLEHFAISNWGRCIAVQVSIKNLFITWAIPLMNAFIHLVNIWNVHQWLYAFAKLKNLCNYEYVSYTNIHSLWLYLCQLKCSIFSKLVPFLLFVCTCKGRNFSPFTTSLHSFKLVPCHL